MIIRSRMKFNIEENPNHTTYINTRGEIVPSVTTILKVLNKESLIFWANSLGWKRKSVKKELDSVSLIGTLAHEYIEARLLNDKELKDSNYEKMTELTDIEHSILMNAIQSFNLYWSHNSYKFNIISCEEQMVCDLYGGTCDLVCEYDNKLVILDFKTSKAFYWTMFLQLCAYAKMYEEKHSKKIEDVGVLRLDKIHGNEAELLFLSEIPCSGIDRYYAAFLNIYNTYKSTVMLDFTWDKANLK